MIVVSATAVFWFLALGSLIGLLVGMVMGKEGAGRLANLIGGVTGAVGVGILAIMLGFGDGLLFATAGTLCILFLVNAFHQHHVEDVFGHKDRGIIIKR